jgi:nicotinamidase-related amidase
MQHAFLDEGASLCVPAGREIIPAIGRLVDGFRSMGAFGPEHLPAEPGAATGYGSPSSNCLIGPQASEGAESAATIEALAPRPDELVLAARTYDKFYGTPLELALRSQSIDRIVVTGITTDVCVNSTVLAAANRDIRVIVAVDGVATIHDHIQQACFQIWQNKFARLATSEEVLGEWQGVRK